MYLHFSCNRVCVSCWDFEWMRLWARSIFERTAFLHHSSVKPLFQTKSRRFTCWRFCRNIGKKRTGDVAGDHAQAGLPAAGFQDHVWPEIILLNHDLNPFTQLRPFFHSSGLVKTSYYYSRDGSLLPAQRLSTLDHRC